MKSSTKSLMVTIPHSGELVPETCAWLQGLPDEILFGDADRFVDQLYQSSLEFHQVPYVKAPYHRYVLDLNRLDTDIDKSSVDQAPNLEGSFLRGLHWVKTFQGHILMNKPMTWQQHQDLLNLVYKPFHGQVQKLSQELRNNGARQVYHLDLHSMPSLGTQEHRDPGETRAEIVVSDQFGKSASSDFVDAVITAYVRAGFKVGYNWPYFGGRITETYGLPASGHHTVQVELRRDLYMNEQTKVKNEHFVATVKKLERAFEGLAKFFL